MAYNPKKKIKTVSFRTTPETNNKLENLAKRIDRVKYRFPYAHPMRNSNSKAGLIHNLVSANLTFDEIDRQLKIVEG